MTDQNYPATNETFFPAQDAQPQTDSGRQYYANAVDQMSADQSNVYQAGPAGLQNAGTSPAPQRQSQSQAASTNSTPIQADNPQPNNPLDFLPTPLKEEVVLEWSAPSRIAFGQNRQMFATAAAMVFLICLILFFMSQFLLIAVAIALAFMFYVLNTVPPTSISIKITTYGIRVEDNLYYWDELGRFWFKNKSGFLLLHTEVARFPFRLTLLADPGNQAELQDTLSQVLLEEEPKPTLLDRAADWLERNIPLEQSAQSNGAN